MFVFFKQKTAYEMRISDWSSDVCSSDLPVGECGNDRNHHAHAGSPVGMTRSPRGNVDRRCECCRCVKCPRLAGLRLFSRTLSGINRWLNRAMIDQTEFIVLYRELGVGPDCSVDGLRLAYRRRVADLHPDRGGDWDEG